MNTRLKSAIATALIHVALAYVLIVGLAIPIPRHLFDRTTLINLAPEHAPPPPPHGRPPPPKERPEPEPPVDVSRTTSYTPPPPSGPDWLTMTPMERIFTLAKTQKFVVEKVKADRVRPIAWRLVLPQGTGPSRVTRVRPPNLTTHTVYWPATWPKGRLPIIAWGNGSNGMCFNSSLEYAAFLSEIASHGYFIVAVGNDDIDFPQPGNLEVTPDGRSIKTKAPALKNGVDWAIAENSRAGSPYQGKLDTSKIAYMGHACGGQEAMDAGSADPRTTTIVLLNAAARFKSGASDSYKAPIAHFEGWEDDGGVLSTGDSNFDRAQQAGWPMFMAALLGMGHDQAYVEPDKRWSKAVTAWLDWQLKGDSTGLATIQNLWRDHWTGVGSTGL